MRTCLFNILNNKWEVCIRHFRCPPQYDGCIRDKQLSNWLVSWTSHFVVVVIKHHLTWKNDPYKLSLFGAWCSGDIFSKIKEPNFLLQGKQLTVCIVNDIILISREFWILVNFIYHRKLSSFLIYENFSDELNGNINKWFLIWFNEVYQFWGSLHHPVTNILQMTNDFTKQKSILSQRYINGI